MKAASGWRLYLACWSLSNILFLEQWRHLLRVREPGFSYYVTEIAPANYYALMTNVLLGGVTGTAIFVFARRSGKPHVRWTLGSVLIVALLYVFNSLRREAVAALASNPEWAVPVFSTASLLLLGSAGVIVAVRRSGWFSSPARLAIMLGLVFSPFLVFTHGQAVRLVASGEVERIFARAPIASMPARERDGGEANRLVVIIFDEADYRLMFEARPAGLTLPNFDRLRRESVFATNAFRPADMTDKSIPSFLVGRRIVEAMPVSSRDALLRVATDTNSRFHLGQTKTLFSDFALRGLHVGVVGWSLPYCRWPGQRLSRCYARGSPAPPVTLLRAMLWQIAETVRVGPLLDRAYGFGLPYHALDYFAIMEKALEMIASSDLDLVWIHLPIPHGPRIYDRQKAVFVGPQLDSRDSYPDNLALADIALGVLRRKLETSGLDGSTDIIVTSDHSNRFAERDGGWLDLRVPFMVRLADAPSGLEHSAPFNAIALRAVATGLADGKIRSPSDVSTTLGDR